MTFYIIHCVRKSSRIIVKPTTRVNVLWDAIVPLSATPTTIDRPLQTIKNRCLSEHISGVSYHQQYMTHKRTSEREYYIWERGYFLCLFSLLILYFSILIKLILLQYCFRHCAFCNLDLGITIYHLLNKIHL